MEEEIRSYRDLHVWQNALELATETYRLTRNWPKDELYGLTSQARRAATSIPANIAEGFGRQNRGSCAHFLRIAQGSLKELETHLIWRTRSGLRQKQQPNHCSGRATTWEKCCLASFANSLSIDDCRMPEPAIQSPCIKVCTLDTVAGLCIGCGRTLDEIARWSSMSDQEHRAIMAVLPERLIRAAKRLSVPQTENESDQRELNSVITAVDGEQR